MVDFSGAPTTVGSIVGYLKLNKDDWDAKLKEAKAQADELGKDSPDVHLRTNADEVLAQLEAVRVAAGEVDGKSAQLDITTNETTTKRTLSSSDVTSTGGGSSAAAKIDSVTAAQQKLADAQVKSANAMDKVKAAQDAVTAAESRWEAAANAATAAMDANQRAQAAPAYVTSMEEKEAALQKMLAAEARADAAAASLTKAEGQLSAAQRSAAQIIDQDTAAYDNLQQAMKRVEAVMSAEKTARVAQAQKDLAYYESAAADAAKKAQAAQDAYSAAQDRGAQASKASQDALTAFREAQNSLTSETSDVTAAFKNLRSAQKDVTTTSKAAKQAAADLKVAYEDGARAVDVSTVAYDRLQAVMKSADTALGDVNTVFQKTAQNANGAAGYTGLLVAGIAALIPLAGPLSSMALGGAAAFTVLGGAGVAAILGIKSEMAAGTDTGQAYTDGLSTLRGVMDQLRTTAANGILGSFQTAVEQVNGQLPLLNTEMGRFSQMAGQIGGNVLTTVINGFKVMLPLIIEAGQGAVGFSHDLAVAASSPEFKQFIAYSVAELPQVGATIMALVNAALHLIEALAPLGTVVLPILQGLGVAISAIPVPVLTDLTGAALTVAAAFGAWRILGPLIAGTTAGLNLLKDTQLGLVTTTTAAATAEGEAAVETVALGSAMDFALGPIGLMMAAAGALAVGLTATAGQQKDATVAMQNYTAAVEADSGAIGTNTEKQAAQQLAQSGAFKAAQQLGISIRTLTQATLGNGSAQEQVQAKISATQKKIDALNASAEKSQTAAYGMGRATQSVGPQVNATTAKAEALQKQLDKLTATYKTNKQGIQDSQNQYRQEASALGQASSADQGRILTVGQLAQAEQKLASSTSAAQTAAQNYAAFIAGQTNDSLKLAQATDTLDGDYQTLGSTVQTAMKTVSKATATSLDTSNQYGLANHKNIVQAVSDAEAQAAAVYQSTKEQTGSTQAAVNASNAALQSAKKNIEQHAEAAGMDAGQVDTLINSLLSIPPDIKATVTVDTATAQGQLLGLITTINNVPRVISISTNTTTSSMTSLSGAIGGHAVGTAHAAGGPIIGPGSSTSDSIPAWLSNGEHVLTAADVQAMGGQHAVSKFRKELHSMGGGYLRVGNVPTAAPNPVSAQPQQINVTFTDATTGGVMSLIQATVRQVNASDGRMRAIQTMGGNVR